MHRRRSKAEDGRGQGPRNGLAVYTAAALERVDFELTEWWSTCVLR